jgi:hypothetical protein
VVLALLYGLAFCIAATLAGNAKHGALALPPLFLVGVLVSISRATLTTGDLPVYAEGFEETEWTFYYLREAPFWYVGRMLTLVTGSAQATFFIVDVAIIFLLARAFAGKLSIQLVVLLFAFPSILGFTNIYRQLIASVLMMLALKQFRGGQPRGMWLAVLACTVHVAFVGVCLSLLAAYLTLQGRRLWLLVALPLLGVSLSMLQPEITLLEVAGGTESRGDTGALYVALGALVHIVCARLLWREPRLRTLHAGLLIYFVAGAVSLAFVPDSTGTRIMMISIYLCSFLALVVLGEHRLKPTRVSTYTAILAALLIAPVIISDSAWHLLFGYVIN